MTREIITVESGKINDYLHHVDLREFGAKRILSSFIADFDNCNVFLDCGSSLDIKQLLKYVKRNKIDLFKVKYLITTHHHFDHTGGMWKLYEEVKNYNPNVKILTNKKTKALLNDYEYHLNRAKRTFGNFIGEMKPIEERAFKLIHPISKFENNLNSYEIIDTFESEGSEIKLAILKTTGHTHDHQCPIFIKDNDIDFIFFGEAAGTLYHSSKLLSMPTSMPVYFNYQEYIESLKKLKKINPICAGLCHFGVINGKENISKFLIDNESLMKEFRAKIIEAYNETPRTRYVVDKVLPMLAARTDLIGDEHPVLLNIVLGITYGFMMDLGYRKE